MDADNNTENTEEKNEITDKPYCSDSHAADLDNSLEFIHVRLPGHDEDALILLKLAHKALPMIRECDCHGCSCVSSKVGLCSAPFIQSFSQ